MWWLPVVELKDKTCGNLAFEINESLIGQNNSLRDINTIFWHAVNLKLEVGRPWNQLNLIGVLPLIDVHPHVNFHGCAWHGSILFVLQKKIVWTSITGQ